jgi:predicted MFS family arabinose efflux permease
MRGRWFFWSSLASFLVLNALATIYAVRYYHYLLDYCEGENRARSQSGLDCLEHYQWWLIYLLILLWLLGATALGVLTGVSYRRSRHA